MKGFNFEDINRDEEHKEWLRLSLATGSTSQPEAVPVPLSPPVSVPVQPMPLALTPPISSYQFLSVQPYLVQSHSQLFDTPTLIPEIPLPTLEEQDQDQDQDQASRSHRLRPRRLPVRALRRGKDATITPPYPWATSKRATIDSLQDLLSKGIYVISGAVYCKECKNQYDIEYDLQRKFFEVAGFIAENKSNMHNRAPRVWMNPEALNCKLCNGEKCAKPVLSKKKIVNWLFLLLGQMLGYCKLTHLKYFCKHTKIHRTGAKDRLLYLTYLGLCKQLDPDGPFNA